MFNRKLKENCWRILAAKPQLLITLAVFYRLLLLLFHSHLHHHCTSSNAETIQDYPDTPILKRFKNLLVKSFQMISVFLFLLSSYANLFCTRTVISVCQYQVWSSNPHQCRGATNTRSFAISLTLSTRSCTIFNRWPFLASLFHCESVKPHLRGRGKKTGQIRNGIAKLIFVALCFAPAVVPNFFAASNLCSLG